MPACLGRDEQACLQLEELMRQRIIFIDGAAPLLRSLPPGPLELGPAS